MSAAASGRRPSPGSCSAWSCSTSRAGRRGLKAAYYFTFTGKEPKEANVVIRDASLQVQDVHQREVDLRVAADSETWFGFLANERSFPWALLRWRIRIQGSPRLLLASGKCFPS